MKISCFATKTKKLSLGHFGYLFMENVMLNSLHWEFHIALQHIMPYVLFVELESGIKTLLIKGLRFRIQSDKHPSYLIQRIEAFLVHTRTLLVDMSADEFERQREFLAQLILEKPKKLSQQSLVYWTEIATKQYHFDRAEVEAAYLRTITKDQVIDFFDKYISHSAPRRHRLSVFVISDADGGAGRLPEDHVEKTPPGRIEPPPMEPPIVIDDVISFKSAQGLYPLPSPYIDFNQTKSKL